MDPILPLSPDGDATAQASPAVAMMRAAAEAKQRALKQQDLQNQYKASEEQRMNQQNDLAATREQHLQTQDKNAALQHTMAGDMAISAPAYGGARWDALDPSTRQSYADRYGVDALGNAQKTWDANLPQYNRVLRGQAAKVGIQFPPDATDDEVQSLIAQNAQQQQQAKAQADAAKSGGAQDKSDLMTWRTIVRGNPTSQSVARNLSTAERNLESIKSNLSGTPDPMKDNNAIAAFMGIEKPGVSPTDSDRRAATDTAGTFDKLKLHLSNFFGNTALKLTPTQRAQMRNAAETAVNAYREQYRVHAASQIQEALQRGLDPNKVIAPGVYDPHTGQVNVPQDPRVIFGDEYDAAAAPGTPGTLNLPHQGQQPSANGPVRMQSPEGDFYMIPATNVEAAKARGFK